MGAGADFAGSVIIETQQARDEPLQQGGLVEDSVVEAEKQAILADVITDTLLDAGSSQATPKYDSIDPMGEGTGSFQILSSCILLR